MTVFASWWLIGGGLALVGWLATIAVAYREGRRFGTRSRSLEFSRLPAELRLHGTEWRVNITEFTADGSRQEGGRLRFEQYDSRVFAAGDDDLGRPWTAEGVVYEDKLCCTLIDGEDASRRLGTVMVDRCEVSGHLSGMRCVWSREQNAVTVQPIQLQAIDAAPTHPADVVPTAAVVSSGNAG